MTTIFVPSQMTDVILKDNIYTFRIVRDGQKVEHDFLASTVALCIEKEEGSDPIRRSKILGPACEGMLHYIYVTPFQGEETFIWLSVEEFEILDLKISQNYADCDFCGYKVSECGENHAQEMREIGRESRHYWG